MIWLAIVLIVYFLLLVGISLMFIRPFRTPVFISPGSLGAPQEDVLFHTEEGLRLKGWWIEAPDSDVVAIHVHGFMMNRCELTPLAVTLHQWGISSLVFDCRAHGKSQSARSGFGYRERNDLKAAIAWVRERKPNARIVCVGSSMGSAAIAFLLSENPELADAAVLDSCYSHFPNAINGWWRFLGGWPLAVLLWPTVLIAGPLAGINPFGIDVSRSLKKIPSEKLLFSHGDEDTLALPSEARRNAKACGIEDQIVWFKGCGHSEGRWIHPDKFIETVRTFLKSKNMLPRS